MTFEQIEKITCFLYTLVFIEKYIKIICKISETNNIVKNIGYMLDIIVLIKRIVDSNIKIELPQE